MDYLLQWLFLICRLQESPCCKLQTPSNRAPSCILSETKVIFSDVFLSLASTLARASEQVALPLTFTPNWLTLAPSSKTDPWNISLSGKNCFKLLETWSLSGIRFTRVQAGLLIICKVNYVFISGDLQSRMTWLNEKLCSSPWYNVMKCDKVAD